MKNFKGILGMIMMFGGIAIGIVCGFMMVINSIKNPDMTNTRLLIEYGDTALVGILSIIVGYIGFIILSKS